MAAALLRAGLAERASAIAVDSAGFVSEGMPPPKEVLDTMYAVGVDLSDHRSRLVRPDMIQTADLVVGMTRQHVIDAALLAPGAWTRCFTAADLGVRGETVGPRLPDEDLASWVSRLQGGRTRASIISLPLADDISDPMGGRPRAYQKTRDVLAVLATHLVGLIAQLDHPAPADNSLYLMSGPDSLRIALTVYRGNPHSGGQGVYTRHLSRQLVNLGHRVTVFAGQPWPVLDEGVGYVPVPSLDLYRHPDPFRIPTPWEFHGWVDLAEFGLMCTAGFPEPRTFSWRVRKELARRRGWYDVIHDNQTFGSGLLGVMADGWPLLGTCHHPVTVDRSLDLQHAESFRRKATLWRWYGFLGMQKRVARQIPRILTVSSSSKRDIVEQYGIQPSQLEVVPIGVDDSHFRPRPEIATVPGRIMTTASADVPFKGLLPLVEAVAKVRTERPEAHLVVVGRLRAESPVAAAIDRLGLGGAVRFESGISDQRMVELYGEAQVAVVPSLYEGFSLPAVEAMASSVPLVTTTGGALPEVVGEDGVSGILVAPGDPSALAMGIERILTDPALGAKLADAARTRVLERFTWRACAVATVENYRWTIEHHRSTHPVVC